LIARPGASDALVGGGWDDRVVRATVLIVDDHENYRRSASALLEAEGFVVVGEARSGSLRDALAGALGDPTHQPVRRPGTRLRAGRTGSLARIARRRCMSRR
jgi:hypothetical protein